MKSSDLSKVVKAFRLDNLLTQVEAAKRLRVSIATFQRIESGAPCAELTRARIAKRLDQLKIKTA